MLNPSSEYPVFAVVGEAGPKESTPEKLTSELLSGQKSSRWFLDVGVVGQRRRIECTNATHGPIGFMTIGVKNDPSLWKFKFSHRSGLNRVGDEEESWTNEIGHVVSTSIYRLKDYNLALTGVIVVCPITNAGDLSKSNRTRYEGYIDVIYGLRWLSYVWKSRSREPEPPVLSIVLIEPGSAEKDGKQPADGDDTEAWVRAAFGINDLDTWLKIYKLRQSDGASTAAIVNDLLERSIQRKRIAEFKDRRPPSFLDVQDEELSMCIWHCHVHNL
jgi:hypothetical protein